MLAAAKEAQPAQARLQSVRVLRRQRAQAMVRQHLLQLFPQRRPRARQRYSATSASRFGSKRLPNVAR